MKIIETPLPGLLLIEPQVFGDERGCFFESFNRQRFTEATGVKDEFVQDNESVSSQGVIRGLHFQVPPHAQGKLVRVSHGEALDVAVDIRKGSPTFGQHYSVLLSGENHRMLWIPEGFAHGFAALRDRTVFVYKCTGYYHKNAEQSLRWNDPQLAIDWGVSQPLVSDKDREALTLSSFDTPFTYGT